MIEWWQNIPYLLNPIAFTIGFFSFYWYSFFYLLGWGCAFFLARLFLQKKVFREIASKHLPDLFLWLLLGSLLGGKIGYLIFYAAPFSLFEPSLILPYDFISGTWSGITGMSYHGSLLGIGIVLFFFCQAKKISFWNVADLIALCAPMAVFFGRLGNFINNELPGRLTEVSWGMHFPDTAPIGMLRHPSSLYEALLEGVFLFILLFFFRKPLRTPGQLVSVYLFLYGFLRLFAESFREPDPQIGYIFGFLTLGQIFSLFMLVIGGALFLIRRSKSVV